MNNRDVLIKLHKALHDIIELMGRDNGITRFPKFIFIYNQVSLALEDDETLNDLVFLEDIKRMISGMYSGTTGSFSDYGVWLDDKIERQKINKEFNLLRDELPKLASSLKTRQPE